jgi:hypothetical protein
VPSSLTLLLQDCESVCGVWQQRWVLGDIRLKLFYSENDGVEWNAHLVEDVCRGKRRQATAHSSKHDREQPSTVQLRVAVISSHVCRSTDIE